MNPIPDHVPEDQTARTPILKFLLILIAILVVLGLGLFTIISKQGTGRPIQTVTMSDGSQIELLAVKAGKRLIYDTRPYLERWLQELPESVRYYFYDKPTYPMFGGDDTNEHLFVVARFPNPPISRPTWTLRNAEGWQKTTWQGASHLSRGKTSVMIPFRSFPRSTRSFELVISSSHGHATSVATFQISNPVYKPLTSGTGTPVTKITSGTYTLELVKLVGGAADIPEARWNSGVPLEPLLPALPLADACDIAVIRVLENGSPSDALVPVLMTITDPTGAQLQHHRHLYAFQNGLHYYKPERFPWVDCSLYPGDGLGKVTVEFVPRHADPENCWTVVSRISTHANHNPDIVTTSIRGINASMYWHPRNHSMELCTLPHPAAHGRFLSVRDDSGRDILTSDVMVYESASHRIHQGSLKYDTTTSSLGQPPSTTATINMAIYPTHKVTFEIEPVYASQQK